MAEEKNTFKLGLAVILFVVLFLGVLVFIGKGWKPAGTPFTVRFPATKITAKLKAGDVVTCGGQPAGTIRSIEFRDEMPDDGSAPQLFIYISAEADPAIGLRQDCTIVPGEPLIGEVGKLVIKDRGVGPPVDASVPINGAPAGSYEAAITLLTNQLDPDNPRSLVSMLKGQLDAGNAVSLIGKIHRSLDDLNEVTRNISVQLNPAQRNVLMSKLHSVLDNINTATASLRDQVDPKRGEVALAKVHAALDGLNRALGTVTAMLDENRPPIAQTITHVRNTAQTMDEQIAARIAEQLDATSAASLLSNIRTATERLNESLRDINAITATGREVAVSNKEVINRILDNFKDTSDYFKAAIKEIYRNPWRLLYKPSEQESRELKVFDAARAFADAAGQLDGAVLRLQGIIEAGGGRLRGDDPELIAIRDELQNTFRKFGDAESALWKQLDLSK